MADTAGPGRGVGGKARGKAQGKPGDRDARLVGHGSGYLPYRVAAP